MDAHREHSVEVIEKEKNHRNGDFYVGGWRDGPEVEGQYTWLDGSYYEGQFQEGKKHGVGKQVWGSGAIYQGEWKEGHMHGVGTFEAPNGARYQGSWSLDMKHGLGKQNFSNGDVYEGIWKGGVPEGPGRYKWSSGCEYDGEWRAGKFHGQGNYVWPSGEKYDGEWKDGLQDGLGHNQMKDGGVYDGMWLGGRKHGVGLLRVISASPSAIQKSHTLSSLTRSFTFSKSRAHSVANAHPRTSQTEDEEEDEEDDDTEGTQSPFNSKFMSRKSNELANSRGNSIDLPSTRRRSSKMSASPSQSFLLPSSPPSLPAELASGGNRPAFVRYFEHGVAIRETQISAEEADVLMRWLRSKISPRVGSLKADNGKGTLKLGKTIAAGHQSYNLMLALQLGLRYSVGRISTESSPRELPPLDFELKVKQFFPQEGSDMTPAHTCSEFIWKDYAPMVFRKMRESFNIDAGEYMLSLCSDASLRLLNTPGKSGAFFFLSQDDKFFVKSLKKGETKLLNNILPEYYKHVSSHPHTLITRFYGLHRIIVSGGRKFDFVVMGNLFNTKMLLHRKFDLKGSTLGRTAGISDMDDPHTIYKDLDLQSTFQLEKGWQERLEYQVKADCALLETCQIMDYSMLLGIHYPKRVVPDKSVAPSGNFEQRTLIQDLDGNVRNFAEMDVEKRFKELFPPLAEKVSRLKINEQAKSDLIQLVTVHLKGGTRRPLVGDSHRGQSGENAEELALRLGQSRVQLGLNLPARSLPNHHVVGGMPEDVVLYFGIIDILQSFNPQKRLEHHLKAIVHESSSISVTNPKAYSQRFQAFMKRVFLVQ